MDEPREPVESEPLDDDDGEEEFESDAAWEMFWAEEAERRHQLYLSGEMEAYPAEQVIAEIRARLRSRRPAPPRSRRMTVRPTPSA